MDSVESLRPRGSVERRHTRVYRGRVRAVSWGIEEGEGKDLNEFTKVIGCHRKAAIHLLRRGSQPRAGKKRGRPQQYGSAVASALRAAWKATDRLCSKRLHPFLPELVGVLRQHGEQTLNAEVEVELLRMSPTTIDWLLRPYR